MTTIWSPALRRLLEDWDARRGVASFPKRGDFDPNSLRYIIGKLSIIDIHRDPLRFFFRLHGSEAAAWQGFDLTGKFLDDSPNKVSAHYMALHYQQAVENCAPLVTRHHDVLIEGQLWNLEALALPLSRHGDRLDMLFTGMVHYRSAELAALDAGRPAQSPRSENFYPDPYSAAASR
jgi:hypothetical protein